MYFSISRGLRSSIWNLAQKQMKASDPALKGAIERQSNLSPRIPIPELALQLDSPLRVHVDERLRLHQALGLIVQQAEHL